MTGQAARSRRNGVHVSSRFMTPWSQRVKRMEKGKPLRLSDTFIDCTKAAAEKAIHRVSDLVLENHLHTCVVEQVREGNEDVVDEAMDLIRKFGSR